MDSPNTTPRRRVTVKRSVASPGGRVPQPDTASGGDKGSAGGFASAPAPVLASSQAWRWPSSHNNEAGRNGSSGSTGGGGFGGNGREVVQGTGLSLPAAPRAGRGVTGAAAAGAAVSSLAHWFSPAANQGAPARPTTAAPAPAPAAPWSAWSAPAPPRGGPASAGAANADLVQEVVTAAADFYSDAVLPVASLLWWLGTVLTNSVLLPLVLLIWRAAAAGVRGAKVMHAARQRRLQALAQERIRQAGEVAGTTHQSQQQQLESTPGRPGAVQQQPQTVGASSATAAPPAAATADAPSAPPVAALQSQQQIDATGCQAIAAMASKALAASIAAAYSTTELGLSAPMGPPPFALTDALSATNLSAAALPVLGAGTFATTLPGGAAAAVLFRRLDTAADAAAFAAAAGAAATLARRRPRLTLGFRGAAAGVAPASSLGAARALADNSLIATRPAAGTPGGVCAVAAAAFEPPAAGATRLFGDAPAAPGTSGTALPWSLRLRAAAQAASALGAMTGQTGVDLSDPERAAAALLAVPMSDNRPVGAASSSGRIFSAAAAAAAGRSSSRSTVRVVVYPWPLVSCSHLASETGASSSGSHSGSTTAVEAARCLGSLLLSLLTASPPSPPEPADISALRRLLLTPGAAAGLVPTAPPAAGGGAAAAYAASLAPSVADGLLRVVMRCFDAADSVSSQPVANPAPSAETAGAAATTDIPAGGGSSRGTVSWLWGFLARTPTTIQSAQPTSSSTIANSSQTAAPGQTPGQTFDFEAVAAELSGLAAKVDEIEELRAAAEELAAEAAACGGESPPDLYLCPITHEIMRDPVQAGDGYCYERTAIEHWLARGGRRSPMTGAPLTSTALFPNHPLRSAILDWQEEARRRGEQRVADAVAAAAGAAGVSGPADAP